MIERWKGCERNVILSQETGMHIKRLMKENGISVREVQESLGLESPQAVYKWLHGTSLPALDNLLALSRLLGVRMEDILVCTETCRYPLWIKGDALEAPEAWEGCRTKWEGPVKVSRRQGRLTGLSHFTKLQTVVRWGLRAQLVGGARQILLYPGRRAGRRAHAPQGGLTPGRMYALKERMQERSA